MTIRDRVLLPGNSPLVGTPPWRMDRGLFFLLLGNVVMMAFRDVSFPALEVVWAKSGAKYHQGRQNSRLEAVRNVSLEDNRRVIT